MKFQFEKINVAMIERRVREEDRKSKRLVTKVILERAEWVEFMESVGRHMYPNYTPHPMYYTIAICEPLTSFAADELSMFVCPTTRTVQVTPE